MEVNLGQKIKQLLVLAVSATLIFAGTVSAKPPIDHEKATLVSKFAKYITWPMEARQSKFIIGVYKDSDKYQYFKTFFENKGVNGKDIAVRLVKKISEAKTVNILYVSSNNKTLTKQIQKTVIDSNVLIVTEDTKELAKTMVDISFDKKQAKINFKVIDGNINNAKLGMPDLSMFLGTSNVDEILSPSPTFVLKNQQAQQVAELKSKIQQQEGAISQLNKRLDFTKENSKKYFQALEKETQRLKQTQKTNKTQSKTLASREASLEKLKKQLEEQKAQLSMTKQEWQGAEQDKTLALEKSIEELNAALVKESNNSKQSKAQLANLNKENKSLASFKSLFYTFLILSIIALVAFVIVLINWRKAKTATPPIANKQNTDNTALLAIRDNQLSKSENVAAIGYVATDITYAVAESLEELLEDLQSSGDKATVNKLRPIVTLLENFNLIAADQDETTKQNFDVVAYVEKMMMLYNFEFNQSDISYDYKGENKLTINSIPSYIALILINLVNNSLKHGFDNNGNGKISINIEKSNKSGAKIIFTDNGKGMNKNTLAKVFTPYFTTQEKRGYIGIGMSTTHQLITEKLSGKVAINSQEGKGTTVTINLP